jgi:2-polyprenyl-3-methyl-5-hydroxy-6-metoxy-1,4-benzoquinol methylase
MNPGLDYPIPLVDPAIVDKWDKEWMVYLSSEAKWPHLIQASRLKIVEDVSRFDRREMFYAVLTQGPDGSPNAPLRIWAKGSEIVGCRIAELGCGAGFLGKQLGLIADSYLGIDVSQLALAIARGNSGPVCTYLHLGDKEFIREEFRAYDTVVGREFFIHQNFTNAKWVLNLAKMLLRPGGTVCADFYLPNREIPQGIIHPAKSELDPTFASCAFVFSDEDIGELSALTELAIISIDDILSEQRKLVVFKS